MSQQEHLNKGTADSKHTNSTACRTRMRHNVVQPKTRCVQHSPPHNTHTDRSSHARSWHVHDKYVARSCHVHAVGHHGCSPMSLTTQPAALCPAQPTTDPAGWVPAEAEYRPCSSSSSNSSSSSSSSSSGNSSSQQSTVRAISKGISSRATQHVVLTYPCTLSEKKGATSLLSTLKERPLDTTVQWALLMPVGRQP